MSNTAVKKKIHYGWWIVISGFLSMSFVYGLILTIGGIFIQPVCKELGFERASFSMTITLMYVVMMVVSSAWGKKMASGNIRLQILVSIIIGIIGFIGFSMSTHLWQFYISAMLVGVVYTGATTMPYSILINNWFGDKKRGLAMSLTFVGSGFGGMILNPFLTSVILRIGWRGAYLFIAAMILVILVPCNFFLVVKTPEEKGLCRVGETQADAGTTTESRELRGMDYKDALRSPMLWLLVGTVVFTLMGSGILLAQIVPYLSENGFSPTAAASIQGAALGSILIGKPLLGMICDKSGAKRVSVTCIFIFMGCFIAMYFTPHFKYLVILHILCYCFGSSSLTICPPLMAEVLFGQRSYGAIIGIVAMATGLGGAIGPYVSGKVYDLTGTYAGAWIAGAGMVAIAGIMMFSSVMIRNRRPNY